MNQSFAAWVAAGNGARPGAAASHRFAAADAVSGWEAQKTYS